MSALNETTNFDLIAEAIDEGLISAKDLLSAFVNFHGTRLIEDDFIEFLNDEGFHVSEPDEYED